MEQDKAQIFATIFNKKNLNQELTSEEKQKALQYITQDQLDCINFKEINMAGCFRKSVTFEDLGLEDNGLMFESEDVTSNTNNTSL